MKALVPLILIFCSVNTEAKFFSVAIAREKLLSDLFVNYSPASRPARKRGEPIEVSVNIELQHFDFRESDGAFNFVGLLNAVWRDKKLVWDPKDYNNITEIAINQKLVWVPDLEMYNNAPDKFLRMQRKGFVVLSHGGILTWSDVIELTIFCSTNMRHWPRDKHICHLILGSWVYDGFDLDITSDPNTSLSFDDVHVKNMQYEITEYTAQYVATKYECCTEPYISIKYYIEFQRRSGYSTSLFAPGYAIVILTLAALAIKPNRSEKILLNGISLILIIFQLLHFTQNIGKFARGTPYIVIFYSTSLVIVTLSHLLCVFSLWSSRSLHSGRNLPNFIAKFLKSSFVHFITSNQLISRKRENLDAQMEDIKLSDCSHLIPTNTKKEWINLATLLERLALILFSFVFLLLATLCFA